MSPRGRGKSKRARQEAERDERTRRVMRLRMQYGLPVSEIARTLDIQAKGIDPETGVAAYPDAKGPSASTVKRDLARGFEAMRSDEPTLGDLKTELSGYLDEMRRAWLPKALRGDDTKAAKTLLDILDRQAALHGLNAPERLDVRSRIIEPDLADPDSGFEEAPPVTEYHQNAEEETE